MDLIPHRWRARGARSTRTSPAANLIRRQAPLIGSLGQNKSTSAGHNTLLAYLFIDKMSGLWTGGCYLCCISRTIQNECTIGVRAKRNLEASFFFFNKKYLWFGLLQHQIVFGRFFKTLCRYLRWKDEGEGWRCCLLKKWWRNCFVPFALIDEMDMGGSTDVIKIETE